MCVCVIEVKVGRRLSACDWTPNEKGNVCHTAKVYACVERMADRMCVKLNDLTDCLCVWVCVCVCVRDGGCG